MSLCVCVQVPSIQYTLSLSLPLSFQSTIHLLSISCVFFFFLLLSSPHTLKMWRVFKFLLGLFSVGFIFLPSFSRFPLSSSAFRTGIYIKPRLIATNCFIDNVRTCGSLFSAAIQFFCKHYQRRTLSLKQLVAISLGLILFSIYPDNILLQCLSLSDCLSFSLDWAAMWHCWRGQTAAAAVGVH